MVNWIIFWIEALQWEAFILHGLMLKEIVASHMVYISCSPIWIRKVIVSVDLNAVSDSEQSCYCAFFPPPDWKNRSAFCCWRSSSPHVLLSGCGGRRNRYPDLMWPNPGMCWSVYRRRAWSRRPLWELGREQFGPGAGRWGPGAIFTFRKGDREWWVFSLIVLSLFGMFCLLFQAVLVIKEQ